jgi:hypothetical protein
MDFDLLRQLAADGYRSWKSPGPRDNEIASLMAAVDSERALEEHAGQVDLDVARVLNGFAERMAETAVRRRDVAWLNYGLAAVQLAAVGEDGRQVIPTYSLLYRAAELLGLDADALFRERSYLQPAPGRETLVEFALRRPHDKSIAVMGYIERNDRDGLVFRPAPYRSL